MKQDMCTLRVWVTPAELQTKILAQINSQRIVSCADMLHLLVSYSYHICIGLQCVISYQWCWDDTMKPIHIWKKFWIPSGLTDNEQKSGRNIFHHSYVANGTAILAETCILSAGDSTALQPCKLREVWFIEFCEIYPYQFTLHHTHIKPQV